MSCHKVSRALLERIRFGELDEQCDEYLEHVERCADCQREIAVDRELARELRRALRVRVEGFEPSPAVWRAVRLQAADPEPPGPWWSQAVLSLARMMRVAVPATAIMLAAVLTVAGPRQPASEVSPDALEQASRLQWAEQMTSTAEVETAARNTIFSTTPSLQLPRYGGDMPFAEPMTTVKLYTNTPTTGGVIQ
jgi:anti-sigma factor RsiW